jgi:hypothetical protein
MRTRSPLPLFVVLVAVASAMLVVAHDMRDAHAMAQQMGPPGAPARFDDVPAIDHAEEVASYTLTAKLDPSAHTVHGEGTIRWRNASTVPVNEMWLHLYLNAFKNKKSVFLREPLPFRTGETMKDWGWIDVRRLALRESSVDANRSSGVTELWPNAELHRENDDDETDVRVPLGRDVLPNETIVLEVVFDSKLPGVVARTGYAGTFHMIAQWFPKVARLEPDGRWAHFPFHKLAEFYADFGTYDVTLDVPEGYAIGATGPMTESRVAGGRRIERHQQSDVHDFAWTAWDKYQALSETIDGVVVKVLYPPGYTKVAQRELAAMRFGIPHFRARYGSYPYAVLTLVHPPQSAGEAGGMEYPTLITTGGHWYDPKGVRSIEHVTVHEFGHQYFYGMVASDEVTWPFLDEGLNEYATEQALAQWLGAGSLLDIGGVSLGFASGAATVSDRAVHNERVAQPSFAFTSGGDYGALVYARTASILETLRRVYGDREVSLALGRYARRQRFKHPVPEDLFAAFEEVLGAGVAKTLRAALFDKGWVDYAVTSISDEPKTERAGVYDRAGKRETVTATPSPDGRHEGWVLVTRRGTLAFPVDVELTYADGSTERRRWDGEGESTRIAIDHRVALRGVVIDPDHDILIDQNLLNNHATAPGQSGGGAPRALERALYWAQLLVQQVAP